MSARLISRLAGAMAFAGLVLTSIVHPALAQGEQVVVFAAASLKTALDPIASDFEAHSGAQVAISYAGSAQLARQIELGAPADIFISASRAWMDYLQSADLIAGDSRSDLLGNRLVLIGHDAPASDAEIGPGTRLAEMLGDGRLAIAMVEAVPAGIYGKQALISLGLWDQAAARLAQTDNVRAALALVAAGEAPYGIVYATDAKADPRVEIVGVFPRTSHEAIVYPAALVSGSRSETALELLAALRSAAAREVFEAQGFIVLKGAGDG